MPTPRHAAEADRGPPLLSARLQGPERARIPVAIGVLVLIWGTTWAAIRIGLHGIPPFTGVAIRFGLAALLLGLASPLLGVRYGTTRRERGLWVVNAALSFCGSYGVVYWCEQWVPSGLGSVLFATFPLFVALLAHFALPEERLTARSLVGILVGFGGVAVIFSEDFALLGGRDVASAAAIMLASPILSALSSVAVKRWGAGIHPVSLAAVPMGITAGVMGAVAWGTERSYSASFDPASIAALLYLAVFGSAVTFSLYYWLISQVSATRLSLIAYAVPVVAVAVGSFVLREPVTRRMLLGSLLVMIGVALAVRRPKSGQRRLSPT